MGTLFHKIAILFRMIFGQWNWQPPQWLKFVSHKFRNSAIGKKWDQLVARAQQNPRKTKKMTLMAGLTSVAIIALGIGIQAYLDSLPKPDYVEISVSPPLATTPDTKTVYPVTLTFSKSAARLELIHRDVSSMVKMSPEVSGSWNWTDDKTLTFTPNAEAFKTDWLSGTEYSVTLNSKMFPDHVKFESYKKTFTTPAITLSMYSGRYYIDPLQPKNKKVVATVYASQPINTEEFKKSISITYQSADKSLLGGQGKSLTPQVTFNAYLTEAYIETENISIPEVDSVVEISIDKGIPSMRGGKPSAAVAQTKVDVPGKYSAFQIRDVKIIFARNEKFEPEQVFVFDTKTEVKSEDLQKALKVYLLPADHTPPGSKKVVKNYNWSSASEVSPALRKDLKEVDLQLLPTEETYTALHSFKLNVPIKRSLLIEITKGVKGLGDYELGKTYTEVIRVPDYTPELMFMSEGSILSLSGDRKIPLLARNIEKTKFNIGRVLPHQVNFMISKIFYSDDFKKPYTQDVDNMIMENFEEEQNLPMKSKTETIYFSLDLKPYIKNSKGFFIIRASGVSSNLPEAPEEFESEGDGEYASEEAGTYSPRSLEDRRLIMVTDLGLIAKQNTAGSTLVFVQNLRSGLPVEGATVEIIGNNGQAFISQTTDANGRVTFPKLDNYRNEKKPLAIVAKKSDDVSYLPYRMGDRQLSFSRFDVGGEIENADSDQLASMLFSDRGLYRPGDKVNIGIILRPKVKSDAITKLPLMLVVTDPRGHVFKREKIPVKTFSLQDFSFKTHDNSPTGDYVVSLVLIKKEKGNEREVIVGSTTIKVEEFVPDKLKITTQLIPYKTKGWIPLDKVDAKVYLKNLFGSAAESRKIKAEYTLTPVSPYIAKFKDYTFINPNSKDAQSVNESLTEKLTDQKGETDYQIDLKKFQGYYLLRFKAEGFEAEGGRSVDSMISTTVSQLDHLVGFKADGSLSFINKDTERNVKLISLNSDQDPSESSVKLALTEIKYVSSLMKQSDGTFKYQSIKKEKEIDTKDLKISKAGASIKLPTDKAGHYVYIVKNDKGDEINRIDFNVIGEANLSRSLDRNAELQIVLNKEDYQNGEEIELQIIAPYSGSGLITIERDTVYAQKWFKTSSNSTVEKIRIPEGLSGNAYVNVTFLRDINSKEIYMSPLSFGVQPFTVSLDQQKTQITLKSPEKVHPGEKLSIQYSASQPTSLILYGVDEGILQVARYKLPNPLLHFFRKRALQVETYQLLDLLLPEFSLLKEMSSTGGDGMEGSAGDNLNPFKAKGLAPVVFWSGVLNADTNTKTYTYDVPDYFNGSLRIMAVASSTSGVGSTESASFSRGDFIITPTTPVFIAPSDEIHVGVNVSNQIENSKSSTEVNLSVNTSEQLEVLGEKTKKLNIPQGREVGSSFVLKAGDRLGVADLQFSATNGKESATFKHQVSLRPATPLITTVETGIAGKWPLDLNLSRKMFKEKASNTLAISPTPLAISSGLIHFLNDFPHGCTEQIVSQTIPSLALMGQKDLPSHLKKAKEAHENLISVLRTRQTPQGGFSLYGNSNSDSHPASLYVIHYLLEARERGLDTPEDMSVAMTSYLQSSELRKVASLSLARTFAQALYLQARSGLVPTNDLNFLMEALQKSFKDQWRTDAIAIYIAGTYQLLQQEDKGWTLLKDLKMNETKVVDFSSYYDSISRDALLINMVSRHFPGRLKDVLNNEALQAFVKPILNRQLNTVQAAQVILAFSSLNTLAEKKGFPGSIQAQQIVSGQASPIALPNKLVSEVSVGLDAEKVTISGDESMLPVFYSMTQKGFDQTLPNQEIKKKIEVSRVFEDHKGKAVSTVKMGDEVTVKLRLRGVDKTYIPYIVIVDLFPAGFELLRDEVVSNAESLEKREDRLLVYTSASETLQEITYKLKATHKGKFSVPPVFAESMYDRSVQYIGVAQKITVD
ncbi:MAG: alpha-2-macroglobulin [Bdellovibrionales bacterium]|nr:alpha-2-macroglobulin [Bdellovibrionales bacterium]